MDKLLIVPSYRPPHRLISDEFPFEFRFLLAIMCFSGFSADSILRDYLKADLFRIDSGFLESFSAAYTRYLSDRNLPETEVSDIELQLFTSQSDPESRIYTVDCIRRLLSIDASADIHLIIGADQAAVFSTWKDYMELAKLTRVCVVCREGFDTDAILNEYPFLTPFPFPRIDISSSQIRELLKTNADLSGMVPAPVEMLLRRRMFA